MASIFLIFRAQTMLHLWSRRLLPVSRKFLVVALGLPVPTYRGTALDPPLRSRFACRFVRGDDHLRLEDGSSAKGLQPVVKLWRHGGWGELDVTLW